MKILLLHQYFLEKNDSGGSRFNEFSRLWAESGHKVTVLSGMVHYSTGLKDAKYRNKYTYFDEGFYDGVDVIRCHVSPSYNKNFIGRLWGYFSFVVSSLYAGIFRVKNEYDVILVTSPPLFIGITGYILSRLKRIPFVFEVRDLWPESAIDSGVIKNKIFIRMAFILESYIYKKSQMINALTPAFRDKIITEKGINSKKVIMIPNAADFSILNKLYKDFNKYEFRKNIGFDDSFVFTYVGAHGVANHLIQLIDAAERIQDTNIVIQFIGDGMQKDFLIKESKKRSLKNVIFRDPVPKDEVFKYILSSDVGLSVLKNVETFKTIYSNKTFDYMSCSVPILLLIDGVSRQLVENAQCGVFAQPEDSSDIAKKMTYLSKLDKPSLVKMGSNGLSYAIENFDREKLADDYISKLGSI